MTSETFEDIFQQIKDDITKEKTQIRDSGYNLQPELAFYR